MDGAGRHRSERSSIIMPEAAVGRKLFNRSGVGRTAPVWRKGQRDPADRQKVTGGCGEVMRLG